MEHMENTLAEAGLPTSLLTESPDCWTVKDDSSVRRLPVESDEFWYVGFEITTPVLLFIPEALEHVRQVIELLKSKYMIDVNSTCGFHVHLSAGLKTPLSFPTLKRLVMFLWAFEPQLDSLHPPERSIVEYAGSWRLCSRFSVLFYEKWGILPSVLDGLIELEKAKDSIELIMTLNTIESSRFQAYNLQTLRLFLNPGSNPFGNTHGAMETIEFRQHEGTLDVERILNWVRLIGEVTQKLEGMLESEFQILLQKVKLEMWEKQGWTTRIIVLPKREKRVDEKSPIDGNDQTIEVVDNSEDVHKETRLGKIAAESTFTIIDLLRYLDLNYLADYFQTKPLHRVVGKRQRKRMSWKDWLWSYEIRCTDSADKMLEAISKLSKAEEKVLKVKDEVSNAEEKTNKVEKKLSEAKESLSTTENKAPEKEIEVLRAEYDKATTGLDNTKIALTRAEAQVENLKQIYEISKQEYDKTEAAFPEPHKLRQAWEAFQHAAAARLAAKMEGGTEVSIKYDDDDEMWPEHAIEGKRAAWERTLAKTGNMTMFPPLPGDR